MGTPALDTIRQAARAYATSEHRLRLAVAAARRADEPIAAIARAAGVTRQTVYNWSHNYQGDSALTVSDWTPLTELPTQRPHAAKGAPVLVLSRARFLAGLPKWSGHLGKASGYAGDELGVCVPGKIVDLIAHSWALVGDAFGEGARPQSGDRVICLPDDGGAVLATVADSVAQNGPIDVNAFGCVAQYNRWAIVLSAADEPR